MIHVAVLVAVMTVWAADPVMPSAFGRVVAVDAEADALLRAGFHRSATFRALVATIESACWRVFVYAGPCPVPRTVGCLLHAIGSVNGERALYIHVSVRGRRRDFAVATLAHELQHASEVVQSPGIVDPAGMRALFERIGFESVVAGAAVAFETRDAERTGDQVRRELADDSTVVSAGDATIR